MAEKIIPRDSKCDYCDRPMAFIGGVKATKQLFKACKLHKAQAEADLKAVLKKRRAEAKKSSK